MVVAQGQKASGMEKRKRGWFRFRFGLRTLLIFVALVAMLLSLEAKRAADQSALIARLEEMGGRCQLQPRRGLPLFLARWLNQNQILYVHSVTLTVVHAPSYIWGHEKIVDSAEVEELLRMPAMRKVGELKLRGTSVTDDILDELTAMKELKAIVFQHTTVTEDTVRELEAALPDCAVEYSREINGPHELNTLHRAFLMRAR